MSVFGLNGEGLNRGMSRYGNGKDFDESKVKRDADGKFGSGGGNGGGKSEKQPKNLKSFREEFRAAEKTEDIERIFSEFVDHFLEKQDKLTVGEMAAYKSLGREMEKKLGK